MTADVLIPTALVTFAAVVVAYLLGYRDRTTETAPADRDVAERVAATIYDALEEWSLTVAETPQDEEIVAARALFLTRRLTGVRLDAVVAANDLLAIGVVRAARERGLSVPDDLAVTGMDDTEIGRMVQPALTSVSLGTTRRGQLAAELMLARLGESPEPPQLATVGPELMVRESSVRSEL